MLLNRTKYSKLNSLLLACTALFYCFNGNTQIGEWFRVYAEEEGAPERFDHLTVNFFHTNWLHNIPGIEQQPFSFGADFSMYTDVALSKRGNVSFAFGLNYNFNNVHHNADLTYTVDSNTNEYTHTNLIKSTEEYKKNKLFTNYIEVPLELRFRKVFRPKLRFYLGFKAGWLITSNETRITKDIKYKLYRIKHLNRLRYGPTLRFGFGKLNFYGFYSLTPLFINNKGPEIIPFNAGITIFLF